MAISSRITILAVTATVIAMGTSCNLDPVHRSNVNNLGDEKSDLYPPESEFHRPGEPCVVCHSDKGPADQVFVAAGTVFWGPDDYNNRADQAYVRIRDANGAQKCFVTNCNGNFFVKPEDFPRLTFPLLVSVERTTNPGTDESILRTKDGNQGTGRKMTGHVGREASCATCHIQGIRDFGSPGQIRLFDNESTYKDLGIPKPACPPGPNDHPQTMCPEDR